MLAYVTISMIRNTQGDLSTENCSFKNCSLKVLLFVGTDVPSYSDES